MSKFVAKFRKERDYSDDYNFTAKRGGQRHDPAKKLINQEYDAFLSDYEGEFVKPARKKAKRFN